MIQSQTQSQANAGAILQATEDNSGHLGVGAGFGSLAKLNIASEVLRALPAEFVKRHRVLPFKLHNGTIHIATAAPGNQRVIDDIRLLSGLEVEESVVASAEVAEKISECYQQIISEHRHNDN